VIEIDPRGDPALVQGVDERPARIADAVLHAIDPPSLLRAGDASRLSWSWRPRVGTGAPAPDRVVRLDSGCNVEEATRAELFAQNGRFTARLELKAAG
jgi:hypothetical protein